MHAGDGVPKVYSRSRGLIVVRKLVARGANAVVFLAEQQNDHAQYALKQIARNNKATENMQRLRANNPARLPRTSGPSPLVDRKGTEEAKIRKEIAIMMQCNHPNIVKIEHFFDDATNDYIYLLLEYMGGGELQWRSGDTDAPYLTMHQTRRVMRDIVLGLGYLHSQGIIHRDIKPANILWTTDRSQVKIGDFGTALRVAEAESAPSDGTPSFLAPEIAPGGDGPVSITVAVDLWALGVTLYALLFGSLPFVAPDSDYGPSAAMHILFRVIRDEEWATPSQTMSSDQIHVSDADWSDDGVLYLLKGLLTKPPEHRFNDEMLKSNGWLFADIQQPEQWRRDLIHPPLVLPPSPMLSSVDLPSSTKPTTSKYGSTTAIPETKTKWTTALSRRVSNLFRSPRQSEADAAAEGRGPVRSDPESTARIPSSAKGKGKAVEPPLLPVADSAHRRKGFFGTLRGDMKPTSAARHSVEALGNPRVAAANGAASGGVVVTAVGEDNARPKYIKFFDERNGDAQPLSVGKVLAIDDGISTTIVMPQNFGDEDGSGSSGVSYASGPEDSDVCEEDPRSSSRSFPSGLEDSDYGDQPTNVYGDTSSGEDEPVEFRRRVRPEPRGPGHGG
ncbi:Other/CAMKK/ELM protein kinase [Mycena chlorophos]|uniref:Other/CAMKK/ELM protein kinase n=1 Tax=Mycena chlorophos TaxID=658473 RepID=A0A8H6T9E2_MYCCL|nr:Other/CAMKK/ELM protein kinase [Mycena chlorophos]KAF7313296.1 Other/CAMKK/ELM protein kinase [Mycena chlorophos]